MVGEIRDRETCQIGMQAALTGHLVFSTVHTNDAPSAFTRLLDLGVEEFLLNAGLISIVAQRLVRKLCEHCKREATEGEISRALAGAERDEGAQFFEAVGCDQCSQTGYRGRLAITEYFRCDEAIQRLPKDENFLRRAREHMQAHGIRNLQEDGLAKAGRGLTTIEEVLRVAG
jgi:general secretion pathway protein E